MYFPRYGIKFTAILAHPVGFEIEVEEPASA